MGIGEFYSLACALAWAVAIILFKKSGEHLPPFALNLFKNVLMLTLLVPTVLLVNGPQFPALPGAVALICLLSGLIGIGIADTLYLNALNLLGASRAGIAGTMYSPWVIVLSAVALGERLAFGQWLGVALVITGIVATSWSSQKPLAHERTAVRRGFLSAALAMFLMASGIVMVKPALEAHDFLWVATLRMVGGVGGMLIVIAWKRSWPALIEQYRRPHHWPTLFAGGFIGTYVALLLWLAGYKYAPASVAAVLNESAAIFILLLARLWLKEHLSRRQWLGASIAVGGVLLVVSL